MKLQKTKKPFAFIILVIAMFLFSSADAQDIHPSGIIQIQKADVNMLKKLASSGKNYYENELEEEFRNKKPRIKKRFVNNFPNNSASPEQKKPNICPPIVQSGFEGNPLTPFYHLPVGYYASECNVAISNAGKIVSISNGWLRYYNESGTLLFSDSLYHFGNGLIDVRLLYDPKKDRFVFITQYGVTDFNGVIFQGIGTAVAFSKTNDPADGWNMYFLPDTMFGDNCSGDYPMLGMSDDEIFISESRFNKGGNTSNHSSIVQINKNDGYAGLATVRSQFFTVKCPGGLLYADLIPAQGGSSTYGPNIYFVMANETGRQSNVYRVYEINNTIASGQAILKIYGPINSNISFVPKQNAYQPGEIPLNSDGADVDDLIQNAFYENGLIQFCQHTNVNGKAATNIGRISGIPNNLTCTTKTISDPNLYLSYPAIAYTGNSSSDNSAIVGIEHSGANTYPGLSAVYINSNFDISPLTSVKAGADTINGLWGDYSGICRRYNHPGEVWFEGQYGSTTFTNINWIAKLNSPLNCEEQTIVSKSIQTGQLNPGLKIYPNPLSNSASISFTINESKNVSIKIFDANGKMIKVLADKKFEIGQYEFKWNTEEVGAGIYFLHFDAGAYSETKKLSVIK